MGSKQDPPLVVGWYVSICADYIKQTQPDIHISADNYTCGYLSVAVGQWIARTRIHMLYTQKRWS